MNEASFKVARPSTTRKFILHKQGMAVFGEIGLVTPENLNLEENIHLPLQGLDYTLNSSGLDISLGRELSSSEPLSLLVAPALDVYPRTNTLLRDISPPQLDSGSEIDEKMTRQSAQSIYKATKRFVRQPATALHLRYSSPGSQCSQYIHQLRQMICIVVRHQQCFPQDSLSIPPRNFLE